MPKDTASKKGKKAFRWTIPHFPAGDSVEFTLRAVAPSSDKYEAALYYVGIIFEKIVGEPPPVKKVSFGGIVFAGSMIGVLALLITLALSGKLQSNSGEKLTRVERAGCDLQVDSLFEVYSQNFSSPWHIKHRILNIGSKDCVIQSQTLNLENPTVIKAGETLDREQAFEHAPKLLDAVISIGASGSPRETTSVSIYAGH